MRAPLLGGSIRGDREEDAVTTWELVHRPDDGEAVGWLEPGPDGTVVPRTLPGTVAGPAQPRADARELLATRGLAMLPGRWWCRLPDPLPRGRLAADRPGPDWSWQPVTLVEVSPTGCLVGLEWPAPGTAAVRAELPVPVGDLLVREPPP
ncbi:hypothetical protein [Modestobacter sp. SYSU DS0290]